MAVAITINSFYRDNGVKAAERSMKRLERIARDNGTTLTDSQRKSAAAIGRMAGVGDKFTKIGNGLQTVGRGASKYITLPVVAASAASVSAFKDFDDAMSQSWAIMGDLDQQTKDKMSSVARTVATSTRTSHKEAAMSYYYLASAGFDAQQSIKALPAVARFAQAGMFDMETATSLAADAESALGLKSKNAEKNMKNMVRVTDVLTKANILANGSVQEFSEALTTKAGAALKTSHKSVEEGTAVLAALADQGVKGADAGQALNQFLRDIPRAASKNSAAFKQFGISVFDSNGNLKNSATIMSEFEKHMGKMSDEEKAAAFQSMGLNRGVQGVIKMLMGSSPAIRKYQTELEKAGGMTAEVANKQLKSAQAKFDLAKNKLTDAAITAGPTIMRAITPIISEVTKLADSFNKLDPETQRFIVKAGLISAAAGPSLVAIGRLTTGIGTLIKTGAKLRAWALEREIAKAGQAAAGAEEAVAGTAVATGGLRAALVGVAAPLAVTAAGLAALAAGSIVAGDMIDNMAEAKNAAADADFYASAEGRVITASRVSAAAKRENASATTAVKNAEELAKGAALDLEGSELAVERAHKSAASAKKTYGKKSLEYREAAYQEKIAEDNLAKAKKTNTDAQNKAGLAHARQMASVKKQINADRALSKSQTALKNKLQQTGSAATSAGKKVGTGYASSLRNGVSKTRSASASLGKSATSGLLVSGPVRTYGKKSASAFAGGVSSGKGAASKAGKSVSDSARRSMKPATSVFKSAGASIARFFGIGVDSGKEKSKTAAKSNVTAVRNSLSGTSSVARPAGRNVSLGFARGISSGKYAVINASANLVSTSLSTINSKAQIKSPARLFYAPGKYISLGLAKGIKAGSKAVATAAEKAAQTAYDKVQSIVQRNKDRVERGRDIANTWGLFDSPDGNNERTVTTGKTLSAGSWGTMTKTVQMSPLEAAREQNKTLKSWEANIEKLSRSGASKELIKDLRAAGPGDYKDVAALASMNTADIKEYNALYKSRQSYGQTLSRKELGKTESTNVTVHKGAVNVTIHNAGKMSESQLEKAILNALNKALRKNKTKARK